MKASDYCISLEMAQRPELRAAMEAAGYFPHPNCKVVTMWWGEAPKSGSGDWQLFIHRQMLSELESNGGHIAYHLGELWVAAGKPRWVGSPDELAELVIALHAAAAKEQA